MMKWKRNPSHDLKVKRNKAIVRRYEELLQTHKHNHARIEILTAEFFLTKQRLVQILKDAKVYFFTINKSNDDQTRGTNHDQ